MNNPNARLEAFCDGVFAIAITLLVIEIKIPELAEIAQSGSLWASLAHLLPKIFAFGLSFFIILITWANHHAMMKLVDKTSYPFVYANGFLLLGVAILPFPTGLLGEYLFTAEAAPAVMLFSGVDALQAIGWILLAHAALSRSLTRDDASLKKMKAIKRNGYYALLLYSACTVVAFWFPVTIAAIITLVWFVWLVVGINLTE